MIESIFLILFLKNLSGLLKANFPLNFCLMICESVNTIQVKKETDYFKTKNRRRVRLQSKIGLTTTMEIFDREKGLVVFRLPYVDIRFEGGSTTYIKDAESHGSNETVRKNFGDNYILKVDRKLLGKETNQYQYIKMKLTEPIGNFSDRAMLPSKSKGNNTRVNIFLNKIPQKGCLLSSKVKGLFSEYQLEGYIYKLIESQKKGGKI